MNNLKDYQTFIDELINKFPEIENEILDDDYAGIISLQIGCFMRFTQNAIETNNYKIVKKCFNFVDSNIGVVEHKIENSLIISYIDKLDVKNANIEKLLTQKLRKILIELNNYNTSSSKNIKLQNFLDSL